MPYEIRRVTLSTSNTLVLEGRKGRKSVAFRNVDATITIHLTQGSALTGFPIGAGSGVAFDHIKDGKMVEDTFQIAAESGTPTVAVIENW